MSWLSMIKVLSVLEIANCARILIVVPTPSLSHQVVFRPITQELVKRGHEVVIITTDPAFPKGETPTNLTEIDVQSSYIAWRKRFVSKTSTGLKSDVYKQLSSGFPLLKEHVIEQLKHHEVQKMLTDKAKFDLLVLEGWVRPALVFSHFFKAPTVLISSFGGYFGSFESTGALNHPIVYPTSFGQRFADLSIWDRISELYFQYKLNSLFQSLESVEDQAFRNNFGHDVQPLRELKKNVQMLFLNVYPIWDGNRPVPPSVVYMGGIHRNPENKLPEGLKSYLDSSKNGVIYVSFGTNVKASDIPSSKIQAMIEVFSKMPYDILWKWDKDEMPGRAQNIKISKWFPQSDLLRHPKIKLFVMQAGLQSTDEAILAGVPMIGIPMLGDQWYNSAMYVKHGLGLSVHLDTMTSSILEEAVQTVLNNESYRHNVIRFRSLVHDQQVKPLDRVIWWMEHIIRHGGGSHLRAPAINMPWTEYFQIDIVLVLLFGVLVLFGVFLAIIFKVLSYVHLVSKTKTKQN